jgi:predicted nucleotidyltransferase
MRVLFDQATPVPIREFLIGHTVRTAAQEHWDTLKNGDLLTAAEELLQRKVDVLTDASIHPALRQRVTAEARVL